MAEELHGRPQLWNWVVLFVVITLVVLAGGYAYYTYETERIRHQEYNEIAAIAKLKAESIKQWRQGMLGDVWELSSGPLWKRAINEWLQEPNNEELLKDLRDRLVSWTATRWIYRCPSSRSGRKCNCVRQWPT